MAASPIDVHYRIDGPEGAPVLVLSHAMGAALAMWEPQMARLSEVLRVVRYDHRGHGASPVPPGPNGFSELGLDVLQLLDRLELPQVFFAGISLGGMVGLWLAANAPERVDRLVVCCSAARMPRPEDYRARAQLVRTRGIAAIADTVLGRWFTPGFATREPKKVAAIRAMVLSTPPEGYAGCCEALAEMDLREDLPQVNAPTLVIAAAQDQSTPPPLSEEIVRGIPGAELSVIDGAAHLANVEQPDIVTDQLIDFLV
jgi:3-oxoadipate enol-lactonase